MEADPFGRWFEALEKRHLARLTFSEVRRSVQALSSLYIGRRGSLEAASALSGAGKRAAFAMFFGPLHFLLVREIVRALGAGTGHGKPILDLGCGTGAAGAAWALEMDPRPKVIGVDRSSWAAAECRWTYETFGIRGSVRVMEIGKLRIPAETAVIAAFTINELGDSARDRYLGQLLQAAGRRSPVLIVEPIARRLVRWWNDWAREWTKAGGREDSWRFRIDLPERLRLMDRAAGLDHRELTGRSLWLPGDA